MQFKISSAFKRERDVSACQLSHTSTKKVIFQITSNANVSVSVRFIKLRLTQIHVLAMKKSPKSKSKQSGVTEC